MTKEEVTQLICMNFSLYKLGAKPLTENEMHDMVTVWAYQFRDYPVDMVKQAFLDANRECVFPITVADICSHLPKEDMADNWRQLKAAISKVEYYMGWRACPMLLGIGEDGRPVKSSGTEEIAAVFDALPRTVKKWLGSSSELVNLSRYSEDELDRYRRPEFMKLSPEPLIRQERKECLTDGKHTAGCLPENRAGAPAQY